jgi:hypothetical protein
MLGLGRHYYGVVFEVKKEILAKYSTRRFGPITPAIRKVYRPASAVRELWSWKEILP